MSNGAGELLKVVGLTISVLSANVLAWQIAYMKRLGVRPRYMTLRNRTGLLVASVVVIVLLIGASHIGIRAGLFILLFGSTVVGGLYFRGFDKSQSPPSTGGTSY
jgi:hypothetical protein